MNIVKIVRFAVPALALLAGCRSYEWKSPVDPAKRTVCVPVFRDETKVTGFGDVVTRQVLREIQREGTFAVRSRDEAALEIQAILSASDAKGVGYDRRTGLRDRDYRLSASAKVSVIDRTTGRILVDNRRYSATTTFVAQDDLVTGQRDASGRVAEDLARQIVDDLAAGDWCRKMEGDRK